jgi:DNA polymerase III delta subunit
MTAALVRGDCAVQVSRRAAELEWGLFQDGWNVSRLSGDDPAAISAAAAGSIFFEAARTAYVVRSPAEAVSAVKDLVESALDDPDTVVILVHEGKTKKDFKKVVEPHFKKGMIETFNLPGKPWEIAAFTAGIAVREATRLGTPMGSGLAEALVARSGDDPGAILFEVLKAHTLARISGSAGIEPGHVAGSIAAVAELGPAQLEEALALRSPKAILSAARRIGSRSSSDPTMWAVGWLTPSVVKWSAAASTSLGGGAASAAGINPWVWKNRIEGPARRWGSEGCAEILAVLAGAEAAVKYGAASPWNMLSCGLAGAATRSSVSG